MDDEALDPVRYGDLIFLRTDQEAGLFMVSYIRNPRSEVDGQFVWEQTGRCRQGKMRLYGH